MAIPGNITIGRSLSAGPFRVREIAYGPAVRQPPHAHGGASVTLILSGAIRERMGSREESGGALSVVVKPAGVEHADEVGPDGAQTLQVAFDPHAALGADDVDCLLPRWHWLHGSGAAQPMLTILRVLRDWPPSRDAALEDAVIDALGVVAERPAPRTAAPPWLRRAREALDDRMPAHVTVRELADIAGVHPVSLSRAFHRHYGCTISTYRRRERLRRAAAELQDPRREISRVAFAAGYADHPHLCRDFRRATGLTPTDFRRLTARP